MSNKAAHPSSSAALWSPFIIAIACVSLPSTLSAQPVADEVSIDERDGADRDCPPQIPEHLRNEPRELTLYGIACFEANRFEWALTYYLDAYAIHPSPMLQGAIGRSLHELGIYGPAMAQYESFLQKDPLPAGADRIRGRVEQLNEVRQVDGSTVLLQSSPPGVRVHLRLTNGDWYELGHTPAQVNLRQGSYEFVFEDEDFRPRRQSITTRTGEKSILSTDLVARSAAFDVTARQWRRTGILTLGASLPVAATGITLLALSAQNTSTARELEDHFADIGDYDSRRRALLDDADSYRFWGIVTTATGATGLLAGVFILSAARQPPEPVNASPSPSSENAPQAATGATWQLEAMMGVNHLGFRLRF